MISLNQVEMMALLNKTCVEEKTSADALVTKFLPVLTGELLEAAVAFLAAPARKYQSELPTLGRGATGHPTHTEVWVKTETGKVCVKPSLETGKISFKFEGLLNFGWGPTLMCWQEDEFLCLGTDFLGSIVVERAVHLPTGRVWEGPEHINWRDATCGTFEHIWKRARLKATETGQKIDQGPLGGVLGKPTDFSVEYECPDWQPAPVTITA